jgi:hypothetical protein
VSQLKPAVTVDLGCAAISSQVGPRRANRVKPQVSQKKISGCNPAPVACNVGVMDEPLDAWFKREILAHEAMLLRYLLRVWPRKDEVHDLRQRSLAGDESARGRQ